METKTISATRLFDQVLDTGGFTYNPTAGKLITSGFACPIANTQSVFDKENFNGVSISAFIWAFTNILGVSKPELAVGAWWNPRDQKFYMDIVEIEQSLTLALRKGILAEQQSIYDLNKGLTIWLPSPQKTGTETQKEMYLLQKVKELEEQYS